MSAVKLIETNATIGSSADRQARLDKARRQLREKYEQMQSVCETCNGKCSQETEYFKPLIKELCGEIYIHFEFCDYGAKEFVHKKFIRDCQKAGIPSVYIGKTLADYDADKNNQSAVAYANVATKSRGAFFTGEVGTGKTFLASIIAQNFIREGKSVKFGKVPDILNNFYSIYRGQSKLNEQDLLNELYTADLLVLDDFGLEKSTQFVGTTLCKILDARYNRLKSTTIITSNYSLSQIRDKLDAPVDSESGVVFLNGSRLYDRCIEICKTITFKGKSRRN